MSWWMWLLLLIVVAGLFQKAKEDAGKRDKKTTEPEESKYPTGFFYWPVDQGFLSAVGTDHYQPALKALAGEHGKDRAEVYCIALLVPDDKNPHDPAAIRVDVNGATVGYLARDAAPQFRQRLARKKLGTVTTMCTGKVWGGFDAQGQPHTYGIDLYLRPFK